MWGVTIAVLTRGACLLLSMCVGRLGAVCGNRQCELGEACSPIDVSTVQAGGSVSTTTTGGAPANSSTCCLADCPIVVQPCSADTVTGLACSGHGSCLTGSGVCRCFEGYGGDACNCCSDQYTAVVASGGSGAVVRCVLLAGVLSTCVDGVLDGLEQGVDCGGVCPSCNSSQLLASGGSSKALADLSPAGRAALVTTAVVGTLLAATLVAVEMRRRRHQTIVVIGTQPRRQSIQTSAVCPVAVDSSVGTSNGPRKSSSSATMGDRVAKIIGRDGSDGGGIGVASVSGGRSVAAVTVMPSSRVVDIQPPAAVPAHWS